MKIENVTSSADMQYRIDLPNRCYPVVLRVGGDPTNCKLSYVHGVGVLNDYKDEDKKLCIDLLLKYCKGTVLFNTTNERVAKFIKNNYKCYYYHDVPIGYNNGYQYHMLIKNEIVLNGNCRDPKESLNLTDLDKSNIKTKLKSLLTKLRRKSDYVDDFVDNL